VELKADAAIRCFQALAHPTRLAAFRRMVQQGPEGATPGALQQWLEVPPQTLSFHLKELKAVGLVSSRREGRSIRYFAGLETLRALAGYLMENCCADAPRTRGGVR